MSTTGTPIRIGPLSLYPTIALTNLGVDSNVFNEPNQAEPKSDFTLTVTPAVDMRMRLGVLRLTGTLIEDLVYYQTYSSERSANSDFKSGLQVQLNRVILKGGLTFLSTRERPGFEIDARSQRNETGGNGAVEVRAPGGDECPGGRHAGGDAGPRRVPAVLQPVGAGADF